MSPPEIVDEHTDDQWAQYVAVANRSFGRPLPDLEAQRRNGLVRLAVDGGQVVGGAVALPFAQFFGGRAVPSAGLSLVCVDACARRAGIARMLVDSLVAALRERGTALVALWTPSPGVYRRWGWEVAGTASAFTVPVTALRSMPAGPHPVVADPDPEAMHALHLELACQRGGALARPAWWWDWRAAGAGENRRHYGVVDGGRLTGFATCATAALPDWGHEVVVEDFWVRDEHALTSLCAFLSGHASFAPHIRFAPGVLPSPPELSLFLQQYDWREQPWYPWMLKLIDIEAAMSMRGWPPSVQARVPLRFADGPHAGTDWELVVEGGNGQLKPGGHGHVLLTERGAAAWFSGGWSASRLARLGLITTDDRSILDTLDTLTPQRPWLADQF